MSLYIQGNPTIESKENFNFLVVAALEEELSAFIEIGGQSFQRKTVPMDAGVIMIKFTRGKNTINILTYTPNRMGMAFTAASVMKVISMYQPKYTIFIGTCAGLFEDKQKLGDVLVPNRIFSHESGKYENGKFLPDYINYETGETLRKYPEKLNIKIKDELSYKVFTDIDFCSGGAIINDENERKKIMGHSGRKVSGLDMEAYSIACINHLLMAEKKELIVVKGIMDFARDKNESEVKGNKEIAKKNSANFALELIKFLDKNYFKAVTKKGNSDLKMEVMNQSEFASPNDSRIVEDRIKALLEIHQRNANETRIQILGEGKYFNQSITGRAVFEFMYMRLKAIYENEPKFMGKSSFEKKRVVDSFNTLYKKYGNQLGYYFKNLYLLINYIDKVAIPGFDKNHYIKIIKAQLSKYEILLLSYNCIWIEGDKEKEEEFIRLVAKYDILSALEYDELLAPKLHTELFKELYKV